MGKKGFNLWKHIPLMQFLANRGSIFAFYVAALKLPPNPKSPKTAPAHLRDTLATPPKELAEPPLPAIVASLLPVPQPPAMPIRTSSAPPLPQIGHPPLEVPRPRTPEVMHVLVVEDNLINQVQSLPHPTLHTY
jgi:hypothetical protein